MDEYHKRHLAYDEKLKTADTLSKIGMDERGHMTLIDPENKDKNVQPLLDPKVLARFTARNQSEWQKSGETLDLLKRISMAGVGSAIEDASASGTATKQRTQQSAESFPLEQQQREATLAHTKALTDESGKIDVPGFGKMTPKEFSLHTVRMDRLATLHAKADPMMTFEKDMQTNYGLRMADVIDATKGKFQGVDDKGKPKEYTGVPFVNLAGQQVAGTSESLQDEKYTPKNPTVFARVGPNGALVPAHVWPQVVSKSKSFLSQLEGIQKDQGKVQSQVDMDRAQKIIANVKAKGANLTPLDQQAIQWAKGILGDE